MRVNMKPNRRVISAIAIAIGAMLLGAAPVHASEWDELTYFTFKTPVELPAVTLPAGTYAFKHPDASVDGHVVDVSSEDGRTIYGTFLTIPLNQRRLKDAATVSIDETSAGLARPIRAWFSPGRTTRDEFIYSHPQATKKPTPRDDGRGGRPSDEIAGVIANAPFVD